MKTRIVLLFCLLFSSVAWAQQVQVVHNAADPAVSEIDIEARREAGSAFFTNVSYLDARTLSYEPGVPYTFFFWDLQGNVLGNSPEFTFEADQNYVAVATGVLDPADFDASANDNIGFNVVPLAGAQTAAEDGQVSFSVFHGSTDAPAVDVFVREVGGNLVSDLSYGSFSEYVTVPAARYTIDVKVAGTDITAASYIADLTDLGGTAGVVLASGFLNPKQNQNGPGFSLQFLPWGASRAVALPAAALPIDCIAPINLMPKYRTATNIIVGWDPVPSAGSYEVRYQSGDMLAPVTVLSAVPHFNINVSRPGLDYTVWVRSRCTNGAVSDWSDPLEVSATNGNCDLTLNAIVRPETNLNRNDGSILVLATGGEEPYMYSLNGRDFQIRNEFLNLPAGNYNVFVKDVNHCMRKTTARVMPGGCDVPRTLTISEVGSDFVNLTWSAVDGAYRYQIRYLENGRVIEDARYTSDNTLRIGSLNPATNYVFAVRALCPDYDFSMPITTSVSTSGRLMGHGFSDETLRVYPNPTDGRLLVSFTAEQAGTTALSLRNLQGQEVFSQMVETAVGSNQYQLDLDSQPQGLYFLQLGSRADAATVKVILK